MVTDNQREKLPKAGTVFKVLVCGGRDYPDFQKLQDIMDALHGHTPIGILIEGGARGADRMASSWARAAQVMTMTFPADWEKHGKAAGVIRNQLMLDEGKPDLVVAFPGGRGTAGMVRKARRAGVEIMEIDR